MRALIKMDSGVQVADNPEHPAMDWSSGYEAGKLLRSLRDKAEQWWYFLDHPEVPPDNNRQSAPCVCGDQAESRWGSRSMPRFAQTADLLSVVQTCRRQGGHGVFRQALMAKSGVGSLNHLYCLNRPRILPIADT